MQVVFNLVALRLCHILHVTYANRSAKKWSLLLIIPIHKSLKSTNCTANWFLRHGSSHQTSFRTWQPHNTWRTSSTPSWQRSQIAFRVTFLVNRFFFVGRDSQHARQIKCLILFRTSNSQIWFQELLWAEGFDGPTVGVLESNLYALFVIYFPDLVLAQISVSGTWRELMGIPRMPWASWGENSASTRSSSQQWPSSSMIAQTRALLGRFFCGDSTLCENLSGNHLSPRIRTYLPSPIRQIESLFTISLALRMLCQA